MKYILPILVLLLVADPAEAQLFAEASRTLREADHARMVFGDLDRAAMLYQEVADSPSASRADVARALYSLAAVVEMSNEQRAVDMYKRITTEFPDVSDSFQAARESLQRLGSDADVAVRDYELVMEEMPPTNIERFRHFAVSPDGEHVAVVSPATEARMAAFPELRREVYVMDVERGVRRPLVKEPSNLSWMNDPRWSPDGRYVVFRFEGKQQQRDGMAVANVATGDVRIFAGEQWRTNTPAAWMPDSRAFLIRRGDMLAIRTIDGETVRDMPLGRDVAGLIHPGGVSPNGQFLLYHSRTANSELDFELDVWAMDLVTGRHRQLTDQPGTESYPFWNADGTAFFYSGGTQHVRNIFRQAFNDPADRKQITSYRNARATHPVFLSRAGKMAFVLATRSGTVVRARRESTEPIVRGYRAELSPDGETLYYLDPEPGRTGLWAAALDGSSVVQLAAGQISVSYAQPRFVSPDGSRVAFVRHQEDETALYTMPSVGGPAAEHFRTKDQLDTQPVWSPDGSRIAFSINGDMYILDIKSGEKRVVSSLNYWEGWSLNWSPDGSRIAAFGYPGEDKNAMHVMIVDVEDGTTTQLSPDAQPHYKEGLDWHPDGTHISYMYYGTEGGAWGGDGTEIINVETREVRTLVDLEGEWDYIGLWGPDANYYFSSSEPGAGNEWHLYRHGPDDDVTEATRIGGAAQTSYSLPSFSRDGSVMIYGQNVYNNQLWIIDGIN